MAVNPAEDIVSVWLQDKCGYFVMQNVNVPKGKRIVNGKAVYGGRGKEIDILGINKNGDKIWTEVTVSPNPYLKESSKRVEVALHTVRDKFSKEKEEQVKRLFGSNKFDRLFVYSHRIFRGEQENEFLEKVKSLEVKVKSFESVLEETIDDLRYYSVDPTRIYLYYAKFFLQKKEPKK